MNIVLVIGVLFVVIFCLVIFLMSRMNKRTNIEYTIVQTFDHGQKMYKRKGMVTIPDGFDAMAKHEIVYKGKKAEIGSFHQKYLHPVDSLNYIMMLEEWDTGRFHPIELKVSEDQKRFSKFTSVPNDDVDFILHTKEKYRDLLTIKEKNSIWKQLFTSYGVLAVVGVILVLTVFYMNQMADSLKIATDNFNEAKNTERVAKIFVEVMTNETFREAIKTYPNEGGQGPPG